VGDPLGEAIYFLNLGNIAREQSDAVLAVTNYQKALPLYQQALDRRGEANYMKNLAFTALSRNDRDAAKKFFRNALEIYQEISELYPVGMTHRALALLVSDVDERNSHVMATKQRGRQLIGTT
jgi:tetratricopeptide (TPR) repeat protein